MLAAWRASPVPAAAAARPRRRAPLPALLVAGVRHRGGRRCSSRRARSRCSGSRDGLAAAGWITLAATLTRYADRADQILATTIYPAIVRVRDRADVLEELFAQGQPADADVGVPVRRRARAVRRRPDRASCSATSGDGAIVLLGGLAVAVALQQVGYNWFAFYRARGESWPQAVESAVFGGVVRRCWRCRARCSAGSWGFVAGRVGVHGVRARACGAVYVRRLLPGVRLRRVALRAARAGRARVGAGAGRCGSRCGAASGRCGRRWSSSRCGSAAALGDCAELRGSARRELLRRAARRTSRRPAAPPRGCVVGALWLAAARRSPASRCGATSGRSTRAS